MDEMLVKVLVCFAVYSITGWMLLLIGLKTRKEKQVRDAAERNRTPGRIVEYAERERETSRGCKTIDTLPVVEFKAFEQTYRLEYGSRTDPKKLPVGTDVTVAYDGNDPSRFHL